MNTATIFLMLALAASPATQATTQPSASDSELVELQAEVAALRAQAQAQAARIDALTDLLARNMVADGKTVEMASVDALLANEALAQRVTEQAAEIARLTAQLAGGQPSRPPSSNPNSEIPNLPAIASQATAGPNSEIGIPKSSPPPDPSWPDLWVFSFKEALANGGRLPELRGHHRIGSAGFIRDNAITVSQVLGPEEFLGTYKGAGGEFCFSGLPTGGMVVGTVRRVATPFILTEKRKIGDRTNIPVLRPLSLKDWSEAFRRWRASGGRGGS